MVMDDSKRDEPWVSDEFWVSPYNFETNVTNRPEMPDRIRIYDLTLRDGEQTPGVVFRKDEKVAIAKLLDEIGVDRIEAGMPVVSGEDQEAIREIAELNLNAKIYCACNARESEIDLALSCGVDGIMVGIPTGYPRIKYEFPNWTEEDTINIALKGVSYAKAKGLKVTLFLIDSSRSKKQFLETILSRICKEAPPDAVAIVDTSGCLIPAATANNVRFVKQLTGLPVEIHTHNDLGLGLANTLAAIEEGAEVAHVSVNGLGERGGNVALDELAIALRCLYGQETMINYHRLTELSKVVEAVSNIPINRNKPVSGDGIYCRESGLGIDVVKKAPLGIFSLDPEAVGQSSRIVLGKKSGKKSIEFKVNELGIEGLDKDEQVREVLGRVKQSSIRNKRLVDDDEFREIISSVLGNR